MKNFRIYTFLTFLSLGSVFVSAQGMRDLYSGGHKDKLINGAAKVIRKQEPTFNPVISMIAPTSETSAEMGFERVYKSANRFFELRNNKRKFSYRFTRQPDNITILIQGVGSNGYLYKKIAGLKAVIAALPILTSLGDEAVSAIATKEAILKNSIGEIIISNRKFCNGLRHNAKSFSFIKDWFSKV